MPKSQPEQTVTDIYNELSALRRQANPGAVAMRAAEVQLSVSSESAASQVALMQNPHYDLPSSIILGRD